jgi:hypothetical protein
MILHKFVSIAIVFSLGSSAIATQPNVTRIDIGNDIGKKVGCEGRLYAPPTIHSLSAGERSADVCSNKDIVCGNITVEKCPIYRDIEALRCTKVAFKRPAFDKLKSAALEPTDTDILEEMKNRGTSFKQNDRASRQLYDKLMKEKIGRKPLLRVSGTLNACATMGASYPPAQCELSACTVEHIEPPMKR